MTLFRAGFGRANPNRLYARPFPRDQSADVRLVANLHLSRWAMARGQRADHRSAHARLLAGFERVRRRASLRGGDARPRQAFRAAQPLGQGHVAQADDERRGDAGGRKRGDQEIQARRRTLYPADVLGRARLAHVVRPAGPRLRPAFACVSTRRRCLPRPGYRSPARLSPSPSPSPCRSTPRQAASIPTMRAP